MKTLNIFPPPQRIDFLQEKLSADIQLKVELDEIVSADFENRGTKLQDLLPLCSKTSAKVVLALKVTYKANLKEEAYILDILPDVIRLQYGSSSGAYYGILTLGQVLVSCAGEPLPCLHIEDEPKLSLRGILLDIGRDKIPTMKTLKKLIRQFSAMKLNHLQLYMDGYCFDWKDYNYLFTDETPLTAQELKELVKYAKAYFIELTPNLNSLGHMEKWMIKPQFRRYAECEKGFDFQGLYQRAPGTIDPADSRAFKWVSSLFDEIIDNFDDSEYLNVNLDEPFELGKGKSKAIADVEGIHAPYLQYVDKMYGYCKENGKKMMMWGDVLFASPESLGQIPKDVTVLHWMYEGQGEFEPAAQVLQQSGLDFVLCPGTSSWCSFTGRSDSMHKNIEDAALCAIRYGAKGILLTDWGDLGHWQYISASYVPFAFGAGYSWSGELLDKQDVFNYCDKYVLADLNGGAAELFYKLGNYYLLEDAPMLSTTLCCGVMTSKHKFTSKEDFHGAIELMLKLSCNLAKGMDIKFSHSDIRMDKALLREYVTSLLPEVAKLQLGSEDGLLIKEEMLNAGRFILHGLHLYTTMTSELAEAEFDKEMDYLFEDMDEILKQHYKLWCARNRVGGFSRSTGHMLHLMDVYSK